MAEKMGTSQPSVARLEAGAADPRLSTLERYAAALGVELEFASAAELAEDPEALKSTIPVTVRLPVRVWEQLSEAATEDGITKTQALIQAISTELALRSARRKGARIVLEQVDGTVERIVFPY